MTVFKRVITFAALILLLAAGSITAQQPQQTEQQSGFVPVSELPPQDQLPAAPLLVSAYAFVWLAVFGYVVSVARRLSVVQRECERLEAEVDAMGSCGGSRQRSSGSALAWTLRLAGSLPSTLLTGVVSVGNNGRRISQSNIPVVYQRQVVFYTRH